MNNKIGVLLDSFKLNFREAVKRVSELGIDGIQIYAVKGEMDPDNLSRSERKEISDIIKSHGLVVSAVCGDLGGHGFMLKEENEIKIEKSKRIIEFAKELESGIVTTHIGVVPEDINKQYEILTEACRRLGSFAACMSSIFAIETGPEKAVTLRKFIEAAGTKGIGVNFDPANLVMVTGDDPVKGVFELKSYIVHTHAKDGVMKKQYIPEIVYKAFAEPEKFKLNFDEYFVETPLGKGGVDFPKYIKALNSIGYKGFLTIEREVGDNPEFDISEAVTFLKNQLKNIECKNKY